MKIHILKNGVSRKVNTEFPYLYVFMAYTMRKNTMHTKLSCVDFICALTGRLPSCSGSVQLESAPPGAIGIKRLNIQLMKDRALVIPSQ